MAEGSVWTKTELAVYFFVVLLAVDEQVIDCECVVLVLCKVMLLARLANRNDRFLHSFAYTESILSKSFSTCFHPFYHGTFRQWRFASWFTFSSVM